MRSARPNPGDVSTRWRQRLRKWLGRRRTMPRSTTPFLGPQEFAASGTYRRKANKATSGGLATYRGNIVVTNLDRALVNAILPPGTIA